MALHASELSLKSIERETRLEPATYSLEGCRSTNWATPAYISFIFYGGESRIRTYVAEAADLQSAPFDRSGISPYKKKSRLLDSNQRPADYKSAALPTELRRQYA